MDYKTSKQGHSYLGSGSTMCIVVCLVVHVWCEWGVRE